jgi:hypothetical protein
MTLTVEWERDGQRMERRDHDGTSEPLESSPSIAYCGACGKTWPARFGAGAPTVRIVSTLEETRSFGSAAPRPAG